MEFLGCHTSIAGGYHRAIERGDELGCSTIQIFTRNQVQWNAPPIKTGEVELYKEALIRYSSVRLVFAHGSYLLNLASPDDEIIDKSIRSILDELERCTLLGLPYLVIHPGAHKGAGDARGIQRIVNCLQTVVQSHHGNSVICIETTAGQGTSLGYRFEHIRDIVKSIGSRRIGACLDTCHIFAAGYDIRTQEACTATIEEFDEIVGLSNLKVIHLNDSKKGLGSRVDRHTHIGRGAIGIDAFRFFMQEKHLSHISKIIETPKKLDGKDMDSENLDTLRRCAHEM